MSLKLSVTVPILNRSNEQIGEYLIDAKDFDLVKNLKWCIHNGYATHRGNRMHKLIMGSPPFPNLEVDHINRNRLDNRRSNLRWVTRGMNNANRNIWSNTGHRGITYLTDYNRARPYRVQIKFNGTYIRREFHTLEEAIAVRRQLELDLYGCNFD